MTTETADWLAFDKVKLYEDLLRQFRDGVRQEHVMLPTVVRTALTKPVDDRFPHGIAATALAEHCDADADADEKVIVLDLGGTWQRAYLLSSAPGGVEAIEASCAWEVPIDRRRGTAEAYFDWIVNSAASILTSHEPGGRAAAVRVAVAFSYPMVQADISDGVVMQMGKGYDLRFPDCPPQSVACATAATATSSSMSGRSFRRLFDEAAVRQKQPLRLAAVVNDTFAPLLAASTNRSDPDAQSGRSRAAPCPMALVLGTGVNCSLIADADLVSAFASAGDLPTAGEDIKTSDQATRRGKLASEPPQAGRVAVNVELSLFGGAILPWTTHDRAIDSASVQPGFQTLEQFVAVRHMVDLVNRSMPLSRRKGKAVTVEQFVRLLERAPQVEDECSIFDAQTAQTVHDVARRSARIVACALTALSELADVPGPVVISDTGTPDEADGRDDDGGGGEGGEDTTSDREGAAEREIVVACTGTLLTGSHAYRSLCQTELDTLREALECEPDQRDTAASQAAMRRATKRRTNRRIVLQVASTEAQVRGLARLVSGSSNGRR